MHFLTLRRKTNEGNHGQTTPKNTFNHGYAKGHIYLLEQQKQQKAKGSAFIVLNNKRRKRNTQMYT